jgi:hypothetical protein
MTGGTATSAPWYFAGRDLMGSTGEGIVAIMMGAMIAGA